jgi:hypothetical protein
MRWLLRRWHGCLRAAAGVVHVPSHLRSVNGMPSTNRRQASDLGRGFMERCGTARVDLHRFAAALGDVDSTFPARNLLFRGSL